MLDVKIAEYTWPEVIAIGALNIKTFSPEIPAAKVAFPREVPDVVSPK